MRLTALLCLAIGIGLESAPTRAHHSYSMFDGSSHRNLQGTVAKLEWGNPHVFVWLYVPRAGGRGFELYGFESDSINELRRRGWTKSSLEPGERVTLEFFPLRDGRNGGHLIKVRRPDGTTLGGTPGPINGIEASQRGGPPP